MEEYEENNIFYLSLTAVVNRLQYHDAKLEHKTSRRIRQTSNFKSMEKKTMKNQSKPLYSDPLTHNFELKMRRNFKFLQICSSRWSRADQSCGHGVVFVEKESIGVSKKSVDAADEDPNP